MAILITITQGFLVGLQISFDKGFIAGVKAFLVVALASMLVFIMPALVLWFFSKHGSVKIDGQKYSKKEFEIYQVMVGGNLRRNDAGEIGRAHV